MTTKLSLSLSASADNNLSLLCCFAFKMFCHVLFVCQTLNVTNNICCCCLSFCIVHCFGYKVRLASCSVRDLWKRVCVFVSFHIFQDCIVRVHDLILSRKSLIGHALLSDRSVDQHNTKEPFDLMFLKSDRERYGVKE